MTTHERDWDSLTRDWRASDEEVPTATLRRLIAAERRRTLAVGAGEAATIAAFAWLSWLVSRDGLAAWETVWLSTLWMFTAIAVPFAWWNRRGTWTALVESVAEYERLRERRRHRTLRFACALFLAEVVVVVIELAWFDRLTVTALVGLLALSIVFAAWALWMRRSLRSTATRVFTEDQEIKRS